MMAAKAFPYPDQQLFTNSNQRIFRGRNLLQIAMPLGGIGAGCINLNGQGGLQDFSIRNTPAISARADAHRPLDATFATLRLPEQEITRLVEGPMPVERIYNQGLRSQGYNAGGFDGLPHFRTSTFTGEYPFGKVSLKDPDIPLSVTITGFSPFIPLDDRNSSIPCVILEYSLKNETGQPVPYEFSYHISHFAYDTATLDFSRTRNTVISGAGVYLYNIDNENAVTYGSCAMGVVDQQPEIKAMWFRGGWFDSMSALWKEVSTGRFTSNDGSLAENSVGRNGASILLKGSLESGASITYPIIVSWYFPNVNYTYGELKETGSEDITTYAEHGSGTEDCGSDCDCHKPRWRPYYASQWKDARDVFKYVRNQYGNLRARTQAFHDALFRSTLPGYILDAVSANLAIIKSPTVLRQFNGNLWAWEGCFPNSGCCHGSCTHVWNYAQAIPHLFPSLERTLREQELLRSMDDRGHVNFRSALPDGPTTHTFHPAADGQLGGIMKVYREWQISGDRDWLNEMYPATKRSMDFCIAYWDPNREGVLMEPHHNTYDIEFWGPDGMCTSFYLGALEAMACLARDTGHSEDAEAYRKLAQKGAAYLDEHLFNGEYYEQKVLLEGLQASPSEEKLEAIREKNPEEYALLMTEGPKYQYGIGCITDGVFGAWLAKTCGLKSPQNEEYIRSNLQAIFEYNFKPTLWGHANPQRPGYAIGDEPGLLLCTWPHGGKPTLPFVYSDEVWTGIEYQAAAHMISEGLVKEGLTVVKALRSRFDGLARNPWNEYECGNYYARAMASYGLLIALAGFRYDAPDKTLSLQPRLEVTPAGKAFEVFFSTATGWGTLIIKERQVIVRLEEGFLDIEKLTISLSGQEFTVEPRLHIVKGKKAAISF